LSAVHRLFFCFIGFKMAVDGILRGAGDVKMFTIANLVNLAIRVLLSWLCAPLWGVEIVWYAVPVGWLANFVISFAHYRTGKWKEKRIA
ncbi:MAG: MATE family efflux transporter, partial [Oscillospiraceae bacterium]